MLQRLLINTKAESRQTTTTTKNRTKKSVRLAVSFEPVIILQPDKKISLSIFEWDRWSLVVRWHFQSAQSQLLLIIVCSISQFRFQFPAKKKEEEKKNKMPVTIQYLRSIARTKMNPKWRSTFHPFQLYTEFRRAINFSVWNSLNANLHIPKTENIRRNCWRVRQNIICMFLLTRTRSRAHQFKWCIRASLWLLFVSLSHAKRNLKLKLEILLTNLCINPNVMWNQRRKSA